MKLTKDDIFVVYFGDTFLTIGTAHECGEVLGVTPERVRWLTTPSGLARFNNSKDKDKTHTAVRLPPLLEDEE